MQTNNLYYITFTNMDVVVVVTDSYTSASRFAAAYYPDLAINNVQCKWQGVKVYGGGDAMQITVTQPVTDGGAITPTTLTVQRGDTVYLTATVPSGYKVKQWAVNDNAIADSAEAVLRLDTSLYPDVDALTVAVEFVYTTVAPDPVTELATTLTPTTLTATWKDPTENFAKTFVTLQEADTLNFIVSQYVTIGSLIVDDLQPSKTYVLSLTVIGVNGLASTSVTANVTTMPAPGVKPSPVTGLVLTQEDGKITATWTDPANEFDYITAKLSDATGVVQSLEVAPTLQSATFDAVTDGAYTVTVTTNTELLASDEVTETIDVVN